MKKKRRRRPAPPAAPHAPEGPAAPPETHLGAKSGSLQLVAGLLLLAAAVVLRLTKALSFANIKTREYSANNLLRGVAREAPDDQMQLTLTA